MTDAVLALNAGSSSIKIAVCAAGHPAQTIVSGNVDRIGSNDAMMTVTLAEEGSETRALGSVDHRTALAALCAHIRAQRPGLRVRGVGHRIVHGGADFTDPVQVTPDVSEALEALIPLAPLHQPHGLQGILTALSLFPEAVHVACFDTAFHAGKPWLHEAFALPRHHYDQGVRRYGFHGLACESICDALLAEAYPLSDRAIAIAHLGNGCSVTAVKDGRSLATSMGFSALDGLAMGTRRGRIDPGVLLHLLRDGYDGAGLETLLYHQSGLLGLPGESNDMRDLVASGSAQARDAIAYFTARAVEEICRMAGAMGGLDAVVFSGGIGENAKDIRTAIMDGLAFLPGREGKGVEALLRPANEERQLLMAAGRYVEDRVKN